MGRKNTLTPESDSGLGRRNLKGPRLEGYQDETGQNETIKALSIDLDNLGLNFFRILQTLNPPPGILGYVNPLKTVNATTGRIQNDTHHQRPSIGDL